LEGQIDLVMIGGGVAGITAAIQAAQRGLKVVLVEKDRIGGVNWGGIATKALISAIELFKHVRDGNRLGIDGIVSLDWKKMQEHKEKVCSQFSKFNEIALTRSRVKIISPNPFFLFLHFTSHISHISHKNTHTTNILI